VREFVETYTRKQPGASMLYSIFQEKCQSLFAVRSHHDPPNRTHIGRALPDDVDVDGPNTNERKVRDRTLLYPPGVSSPDLPFDETVDAGAETESEADEAGETVEEGD
jgi:hypothetical protein